MTNTLDAPSPPRAGFFVPETGKGIVNDILYTPRELANHFRVEASTVRYWCRTGQLGHVVIGSRYRIRLADVADFIATRYGDPEQNELKARQAAQ